MLSRKRAAIALARAKRSGSRSRSTTAGSTGVMVAAGISGTGTAIALSYFYAARPELLEPDNRSIVCALRPRRRSRRASGVLAPGSPRRGFPGCVLGQRLRAADHFQDLLRDLGLAGAVHLQREAVDQLARVLRRVPHRGHPRSLLRRGRLEQCAIDLRLDVHRQQPLHDLLGLGLEDEVAPE